MLKVSASHLEKKVLFLKEYIFGRSQYQIKKDLFTDKIFQEGFVRHNLSKNPCFHFFDLKMKKKIEVIGASWWRQWTKNRWFGSDFCLKIYFYPYWSLVFCLNFQMIFCKIPKTPQRRHVVQKSYQHKVHTFWEGHKVLRNLHLTFDYSTHSQK